MNPVLFLPTEGIKPWCEHIQHGTLKPKDKEWIYSKAWIIKGVRGRFSNPVPRHYMVCPICTKPRPGVDFCKKCGQMKPKGHK